MGQTLPKHGGSRFDSEGKYNTIGGMAATMIEEYTFRVEYLGSLMLSKAATGLAVVQKPLRELYLSNIRKSDNKLKAQPRTIKVRPEGILLIYKEGSAAQPKHVFYDMASIHFKDCVCFTTRKGSDKKLRGGFEPLEEHRKGSSDSFFSLLEKKHYFLADKRHPALFVCIMRRPLGVKALDCHVFIMESHKEALQIVDIIDQLQYKNNSMLTDNSQTLPFNSTANEIPRGQVYRPTEHPSQQITTQRYELTDDFFRPQAYDQYADQRSQHSDQMSPRHIPPDSRSNEVNMQPSGVTVFHNRADEYGRPVQMNRDEVRMRHPVSRNHLNTSFDDRKYLNVNTSFDEDQRRPNGNLSFDENRRPFSMFQEPSYDRRREPAPDGRGQRLSSDDNILAGRPIGRSDKIGNKREPPSNVVYRQQIPQQNKRLESPAHEATVQELTSAFQRENKKQKNLTSTPVNRSLSPTPKTAPKPDRNSGGQLSPIGKGHSPSPASSPGWGPAASMSNLESRQEMEMSKPGSEAPPVEVPEETAKTRPVAKVPPHLVAGVKVLPTEFKVPLRKTSPQSSPRCEDPNRYNNLSINSDFEDEYPVKNNNYDKQYSGNRHNNYHNSNNPGDPRNNPIKYRENSYQEIPYSQGNVANRSFNGDNSRDPGYMYSKPYHQRIGDSEEWGYRENSHDRKGYNDHGYNGRRDGARSPSTGEVDKGPGSLKDKEIASLVSNIYISPEGESNTNFEQSLGYYP